MNTIMELISGFLLFMGTLMGMRLLAWAISSGWVLGVKNKSMWECFNIWVNKDFKK